MNIPPGDIAWKMPAPETRKGTEEVTDPNAPEHMRAEGIRKTFEHDTTPYVPALADWQGRVIINISLYKKGEAYDVRNISRTLTAKNARVSEVYWAVRDLLFDEAPKFDRSWSVLDGGPPKGEGA